MARGFDAAKFAKAFQRPGMDTRQWVSYGTVDADTKESKAIQFQDADGNPSPYGPLVNVTLQPSGVSLPCRVASMAAGNGEADWHPFTAGDEVLVVLPEGDERAGAVIIGRLNQEIDTWPAVVAGQDSTKNTFGFKRLRTPFILETAASYLIRSAKTGSQIGIDSNGNVLINDGEKSRLSISPESIGLTSGDEKTFVQLYPPSTEVYLGADSTTFLLNPTASKFITQGTLAISTAGGSANQHAVTAEQVLCIIINVLAQLATTGSFTAGPLAAGPYNAAPPTSCQTQLSTVLSPALLALGAVAPVGPAPGGEFLEFQGAAGPPIFGPAGALATALANPLAPVDPTGAIMGYGRSGFTL
jgi:hypothetical protein